MTSRLLVVDDHPGFRRALGEVLRGALASGAVIAEASSAEEALALLSAEDDWQAVLMDLSLPGRSGLELLREIKRLRPALPVLVLSMHPETQYGPALRQAGAAEYIAKGSPPDAIAAAVRRVMAAGGGALDSAAAPPPDVAAERERRRIASVLHDDVGQALVVVKLQLALLDDAGDAEAVRSAVTAANAAIDRAVAAVRALGTSLLSPLPVDGARRTS